MNSLFTSTAIWTELFKSTQYLGDISTTHDKDTPYIIKLEQRNPSAWKAVRRKKLQNQPTNHSVYITFSESKL